MEKKPSFFSRHRNSDLGKTKVLGEESEEESQEAPEPAAAVVPSPIRGLPSVRGTGLSESESQS